MRLAAAVLGIVIPAVWFWTVITPGEQAVKIRNGLVAEIGVPADFSWKPAEMPASFRTNRGPTTPAFEAIAAQLLAQGSALRPPGFDFSLAIARYLMSAPLPSQAIALGSPIQSDLVTAHRAITQDGRGYCADFTQVFTGIAVAGDLPVRSWSLSFESFGSGHVFNEIYDPGLDQWILVDAFHSLYFVDATTRAPLSVLEVHGRLLDLEGGAGDIDIESILEVRFPFRSKALALDYYRRGMPQLALVWGNNVFDYDRSWPVRVSARISRHVERFVAIIIGEFPRLRIYPVSVSDRDLRSLFRTRNSFFLSGAALTVAVLVFGWQIVVVLRDLTRR